MVQANLGGIGMEEPAGKDEFSKRRCLCSSELVAHPLSILCQIKILTLIPIYGFPPINSAYTNQRNIFLQKIRQNKSGHVLYFCRSF